MTFQPLFTTFVCAGEKSKILVSVFIKSVFLINVLLIKTNTYDFLPEQCGLMISLVATLRMRSKHCWTSTLDIKLWVRQELLLWWVQNKTWQKFLSSWWNLMEKLGTWSEEPRATAPSQLFSQTPGFQAQLSDDSDSQNYKTPNVMPSVTCCLW